MTPGRRAGARLAVAAVIVMSGSIVVRADWMLSGTVGATLRTTSTFLDLDEVAGGSHIAVGAAFALVPSRGVGVECQITVVPSPFSAGRLVQSSQIVAVAGNVLLPLLRHRRALILGSAGLGMARVSMRDSAGIFPVSSSRPAAQVGVIGRIPVSDGLGIRAEFTYLRTAPDEQAAYGFRDADLRVWRVGLGASWAF